MFQVLLPAKLLARLRHVSRNYLQRDLPTLPVVGQHLAGRSTPDSQISVIPFLDGEVEKFMNTQHYTSGILVSDDHSMYSGWDQDTVRWSLWPYVPDNPAMDTQGFGGPHAAGGQFVLCDGSVRTLAFSIDAVTFGCLCNRNDGEVPSPNAF